MVAANGIYKLAVIGTVGGQRHIHTLHFRSTVSGTSVGFSEEAWQTDLVTQWGTAAKAAWRAMFIGTDKPVEQYQVRKVCGVLPLPAGVDVAEPSGSQVGTGIAGEFNGDPMAPWLASVATLRTGLAGRRYRGRSFIGGLYEPMVTGAVVSSDRQARMQAYFDALKTAFSPALDTSTNAKWFVFSRTQANFPGTQCQDAGADVRSVQVRNYLCTMKSRKAGSGV